MIPLSYLRNIFVNLDNVAKIIKEHPELNIEIQGHTSKTGGFQYNMRLSERRAEAVKQYLVDGSDVTQSDYSWIWLDSTYRH